jgi:hypothetical protein
VTEHRKGVPPLAGTFTLTLDTTSSAVIAVRAPYTTSAINHNAPADAAASGGDGTSMAEILMADTMLNIGEVEVTRSAVNPATGGYTWTITFIRDRGSLSVAGSYRTADCEQRDSEYGLCNAPGPVPALTFTGTSLYNAAWNLDSFAGNCPHDNTCRKVKVLTHANTGTDRPMGSKSQQRIYIADPTYNTSFANASFPFLSSWKLTYDSDSTSDSTDCDDADLLGDGSNLMLTAHTTASELKSILEAKITVITDVSVVEGLDDVGAPNGKVLRHLLPRRRLQVSTSGR